MKAAKVLVVRIAFELQYDTLVTQVLQLFRQQQSDHQPYRFGRSPLIGVILCKGVLESVPSYRVGKGYQWIAAVALSINDP